MIKEVIRKSFIRAMEARPTHRKRYFLEDTLSQFHLETEKRSGKSCKSCQIAIFPMSHYSM